MKNIQMYMLYEMLDRMSSFLCYINECVCYINEGCNADRKWIRVCYINECICYIT